MTREQAIQSIETGIEIACMMKEKGYQIMATGEMGIEIPPPAAPLLRCSWTFLLKR